LGRGKADIAELSDGGYQQPHMLHGSPASVLCGGAVDFGRACNKPIKGGPYVRLRL